MKEKMEMLKMLLVRFDKISDLSRQRYSIDYWVRNRAYTEKELEEDERLEKEIDIKRQEFVSERKAFASTFSKIEEIEELYKLVQEQRKEIFDEATKSKLGGILRDVREDFLESKREDSKFKANDNIAER